MLRRPREMSDRAIWSAGAIKTMQEKGIPIDYIGGTSIGAFVSGAFAMEEGTGFDARQPHYFESALCATKCVSVSRMNSSSCACTLSGK